MTIRSSDGKHNVQGNIISFTASREDAGEFMCKSGDQQKTFTLQIIGMFLKLWQFALNIQGPDDEVYKGSTMPDIQESNSKTIALSLLLLISLLL